MLCRLGRRSPIPRARRRWILSLEDWIEHVTDSRPGGLLADHALTAAIADARAISFPYRSKCAEQLDPIPADTEIRRLHDPSGLDVRTGNKPASAAIDRNDGLGVITEVGDILERKSSGGSRRQRQRLRHISTNHVDKKYARACLGCLIYRLIISNRYRDSSLAVFRIIAPVRPVRNSSKAGAIRFYGENISVKIGRAHV